MQEFMETTNRWYVQMLGVPKSQLYRLMKMGDKVLSVLKLTGKKTQIAGVFLFAPLFLFIQK